MTDTSPKGAPASQRAPVSPKSAASPKSATSPTTAASPPANVGALQADVRDRERSDRKRYQLTPMMKHSQMLMMMTVAIMTPTPS
jgi:hypothetical protein